MPLLFGNMSRRVSQGNEQPNEWTVLDIANWFTQHSFRSMIVGEAGKP